MDPLRPGRAVSRRVLIHRAAELGAVALLSSCASRQAIVQVRPKVRQIGFLAAGEPRADAGGALRQSLSALGYVENRDFVVHLRYAENVPDRLPGLAAELVGLPVDIIVTSGGGNPVRGAKQVTSTVPIVFTALDDPLGQGVVSDLARPGGNVTGVASLGELGGKRLELLKETVPGLSRVCVLFWEAEAGQMLQVRSIQDAARMLSVAAQPVAVNTLDALDDVLPRAAREGVNGLIDCHGASFYGKGLSKINKLLDFLIAHKLPHVFVDPEFAAAGGLMVLGPSTEERWRVVAQLIDKIFKGANPGSLPIEEVRIFDIILNVSTAQKIGLVFPESVTRRATRVVQ